MLYLKGKYLLRYRPKYTPEEFELARTNFEKIIELDPKSPLGHVGLAWLELRLSAIRRTDTVESAKRAEAHTQRALALDENSSDALIQLARIRGVDQWNWQEAEKLAKRAVAVNPGSADVWYVLGSIIEPAGRLAEAEAAMRRSAALDPLNANRGFVLAQVLYEQKRYDDAIALARSTLLIDPGASNLRYVIAQCFERQKKFTDAIAALRLARVDFLPDADINTVEAAFARDGETGYWRSRHEIDKQWFRGKTTDTKYFLARSATLADQNDQAFGYLNEAVAQKDRNITRVKIDPALDGIRGDSRYLKILARLNLD